MNPVFQLGQKIIMLTLLMNEANEAKRFHCITENHTYMWGRMIADKDFFHTTDQAFIKQVSVIRGASRPCYTMYIFVLIHMHFCSILEPLCLMGTCNYPAWKYLDAVGLPTELFCSPHIKQNNKLLDSMMIYGHCTTDRSPTPYDMNTCWKILSTPLIIFTMTTVY